MSLEESFDRLAKAMDRYAGVIEKYADVFQAALKGEKSPGKADSEEKAETPAEKKKRQAAEAAAAKAKEEEEDDGLGGDDDAEEELTLDQVKASLIALRDATGDKDAALNVMKKFGYKKVPDIQPKDFAAVKKAAEKAMP